ncbi:MAG: ABC transporter permease [Candidatus Hinthialibacter antarcticus]|nr:ABC transporter permease [Candidatus Hinthialibacter antarcticus]
MFDAVGFVILSTPALIMAGLVKSAPLLWASLGGAYSERSGVINIGLEGMMLTGAFFAVWGSWLSGSPWGGLLCAALAGALVGLLHAVVCLQGRANQIVSGMGVNIIALGVTGFLLVRVFDALGNSPEVAKLPLWNLGVAVSPLHLLLVVVLLITIYGFYQTRFGLRLRACGESPSAAKAAGVSVTQSRYIAVTISGALAGLGGAQLSIGELSYFTTGMSGGRGFIALAVLICSGWRPGRAALICFGFGLAEALAENLQGAYPAMPSRALLALPFMLALFVLMFRTSDARGPAALGKA